MVAHKVTVYACLIQRRDGMKGKSTVRALEPTKANQRNPQENFLSSLWFTNLLLALPLGITSPTSFEVFAVFVVSSQLLDLISTEWSLFRAVRCKVFLLIFPFSRRFLLLHRLSVYLSSPFSSILSSLSWKAFFWIESLLIGSQVTKHLGIWKKNQEENKYMKRVMMH